MCLLCVRCIQTGMLYSPYHPYPCSATSWFIPHWGLVVHKWILFLLTALLYETRNWLSTNTRELPFPLRHKQTTLSYTTIMAGSLGFLWGARGYQDPQPKSINSVFFLAQISTKRNDHHHHHHLTWSFIVYTSYCILLLHHHPHRHLPIQISEADKTFNSIRVAKSRTVSLPSSGSSFFTALGWNWSNPLKNT